MLRLQKYNFSLTPPNILDYFNSKEDASGKHTLYNQKKSSLHLPTIFFTNIRNCLYNPNCNIRILIRFSIVVLKVTGKCRCAHIVYSRRSGETPYLLLYDKFAQPHTAGIIFNSCLSLIFILFLYLCNVESDVRKTTESSVRRCRT